MIILSSIVHFTCWLCIVTNLEFNHISCGDSRLFLWISYFEKILIPVFNRFAINILWINCNLIFHLNHGVFVLWAFSVLLLSNGEPWVVVYISFNKPFAFHADPISFFARIAFVVFNVRRVVFHCYKYFAEWTLLSPTPYEVHDVSNFWASCFFYNSWWYKMLFIGSSHILLRTWIIRFRITNILINQRKVSKVMSRLLNKAITSSW